MDRPFRNSFIPIYEESSVQKNPEKDAPVNIILKPFKLPKPPKLKYPFETLILSAGSTKAAAHVGALVALEELGYLHSIKRLVGVSSGGFTLGMYSIGYTPKELYYQMMNFDFANFQKIEFNNFFLNLGADTGDTFSATLRHYIAKKCSPQITLSEIYRMTGKSLHFGVTRLNDASYQFLNRHNHPNLPLWLAIRMTTSIPLLFSPVKYLGNTYVDGGCINAFPVSYFQSKTTLAILLTSHTERKEINNVEDMLLALINVISGNTWKDSNSESKVTEISIPLPKISSLNFKMPPELKQHLHNLGYAITMNHLTHTL
jgi:NTE family protein